MKNIHLIPTSKQEYQVKEGNLFINDTRKYYWGKLEALICERVTQHGHAWNGTGIKTDICHLYITSSEEIKEGDYVFNLTSKEVYPIFELWEVVSYEKKIILTTDQDLINNGVQAIQDDFLEWFVNNPKCEEVEVKQGFADGTAYGYNFLDYKIIIPKVDDNMKLEVEWVSNNPQCKQIESCYNSLTKKCICPKEPKQEPTLEEAAERLATNRHSRSTSAWSLYRNGVIEGGKWQQERMYSEKEVFELTLNALDLGMRIRQEQLMHYSEKSGRESHKEWFEQFKK